MTQYTGSGHGFPPIRVMWVVHTSLHFTNTGPKLKAFADDKLDIVEMMISLLDRVKNTVGKGENAGYQHFPLFPQCFPKPSSLGSFKVESVW